MESTLPREGVPLSFHALTSGNNQHDYEWLWKISWGKSLQSGENLKTFVWLGQVCTRHRTNVCKISWLWGATSLLVVNKSLSNLTILLNALFPANSTDFLWLIRKKSWKKKAWKGLFELPGTLALVNLVSGSIRPLWFLVEPGTDTARLFHLLLHHRSQYFHFGTSISDFCGYFNIVKHHS